MLRFSSERTHQIEEIIHKLKCNKRPEKLTVKKTDLQKCRTWQLRPVVSRFHLTMCLDDQLLFLSNSTKKYIKKIIRKKVFLKLDRFEFESTETRVTCYLKLILFPSIRLHLPHTFLENFTLKIELLQITRGNILSSDNFLHSFSFQINRLAKV